MDHAIACGNTVSVTLPSATAVMDDDGAFGSGLDAGESVLQFTVPPGGLADLTVVHPSLEPHTVLLLGPNACDSTAAVWSDTTIMAS